MTVRCLTLDMFKEIIEAWMRWPFRPDRYELMSRMGSVAYDPDDEAPSEK
jgi:transcription factor 1